MENFAHIVQCLPIKVGASSSRGHFGGTSPFKVQVNFDILVFEGQIDAKCNKEQQTIMHKFDNGVRQLCLRLRAFSL
jgi:hypothetical protein